MNCSSDVEDGVTVVDGSNNIGRVITQSVHPSSSHTTTDTSNTKPQGTEATTSGTSTESHTYTDIRPWGELLCNMLVSSKEASSNQYAEAFIYTSTEEYELEEDMGTCIYVTLANKKVGECMYAFLIKDWQWIDTKVKKYATRALICMMNHLLEI